MATVPEGYHTLTPMTSVRDCEQAIAFYEQVFGAVERLRFAGPAGEVMHCELEIGGSILMLSDAGTEPPHPLRLMLYVADCDAVMQRALDAGAAITEPATDRFFGDRGGRIVDPFGIEWMIATHLEDVAPDELQRRWSDLINPKDS